MSRDILNLAYKLYVRPHLDYGDIIYHRYDPEVHLSFTQKIEQTQYAAAFAVAGAWRGTNRQRPIMNWDGKAFTLEDGTVVCVTFST